MITPPGKYRLMRIRDEKMESKLLAIGEVYNIKVSIYGFSDVRSVFTLDGMYINGWADEILSECFKSLDTEFNDKLEDLLK